MPAGYVTVADAPTRCTVGTLKRVPYQRDRSNRLTVADRDEIRHAAAGGSSFRELAKQFGVSHKTIRAVVLERTSAQVASCEE